MFAVKNKQANKKQAYKQTNSRAIHLYCYCKPSRRDSIPICISLRSKDSLLNRVSWCVCDIACRYPAGILLIWQEIEWALLLIAMFSGIIWCERTFTHFWAQNNTIGNLCIVVLYTIGVTYSCSYFTAIYRLSDLAGKCGSQHHQHLLLQ